MTERDFTYIITVRSRVASATRRCQRYCSTVY